MDNEERSMLVSMTRTLYPGVIREEVSFDGLVLGTRRGRARALDTGAEQSVFPEHKRRSSSRRFDFFALILVLITLDEDAALREANVMGECRLESGVWSIEGHGYGHGEGEEEETVDVDDGRGIG